MERRNLRIFVHTDCIKCIYIYPRLVIIHREWRLNQSKNSLAISYSRAVHAMRNLFQWKIDTVNVSQWHVISFCNAVNLSFTWLNVYVKILRVIFRFRRVNITKAELVL